ncbi:MAG: hypothetical protein AAGD11_13095 [Planctomycetota bacterium]
MLAPIFGCLLGEPVGGYVLFADQFFRRQNHPAYDYKQMPERKELVQIKQELG